MVVRYHSFVLQHLQSHRNPYHYSDYQKHLEEHLVRRPYALESLHEVFKLERVCIVHHLILKL